MYRRQYGELGTKLAQSKNRNKIKRDIGRHILSG